MKILFLYRYHAQNAYNSQIHMDWLINANEIPDISVKLYGYNLTGNCDNVLMKYDSTITLDYISKIYNYDVIVFNCANRRFTDATNKATWLPKDFNTINKPKVLIEADFFKFRKDPWIKQANFDMVLHRHLNNLSAGAEDLPNIQHKWLPFSVDPDRFTPMEYDHKINKVGFIGTSKSKVYYYRKKAMDILTDAGLIDVVGFAKGDVYLNSLRQYSVCLSGGSIYSIDTAKAFEIMASGSILLTNEAYNGYEKLFGKGSYITYRNDFKDLITKVNNILGDKEEQQKMINTNLHTIRDKHSHRVRAQEFVNILEEELNQIVVPVEPEVPQMLDVVYFMGNPTDGSLARLKNSYNSLTLNKAKFNIVFSEVGLTSHEEEIKKLIPNAKYYYQENPVFDASIAKNNAYKYLIESDIFVFLDMDMLVPSDFIERSVSAYKEHKKPMIYNYKRSLQHHTSVTYDNLLNECEEVKVRYNSDLLQGGLVLCDKTRYEQLNGFDEGYIGWGSRDSDFNMRLKQLNSLMAHPSIILLHQYHNRNFGLNKEDNRARYNQRLNRCVRDINKIPCMKGLIDLSIYSEPIEPPPASSGEQIIIELLKGGYKICLLTESCYEYVLNNEINLPLHIAIEGKCDVNLPPDTKLYSFPASTKKLKFLMSGYTIYTPVPVVQYLTNMYGKTRREELKQKGLI